MPEQIVFILSTSRTGTKTLAEGLTGNGVVSPHQPAYSRLLTIASNYYLHGWLPRRILESLVLMLREPQILNAECRLYIQVFSLDYLPAKIISERHSDVAILHIVRDPRTFVPSYINWTHTRIKSYIANKFIPGWHPSGYFTGEIPLTEWMRMDEFQRVCWHWLYKNTLLETLFKADEKYLRLRFEDLFWGNKSETLRQLLSFVGIEHFAHYDGLLMTKKNRGRGTFILPWEDLSEKRKTQLIAICGDKMKDYGYIEPTFRTLKRCF